LFGCGQSVDDVARQSTAESLLAAHYASLEHSEAVES
jgi:hypothetical protein